MTVLVSADLGHTRPILSTCESLTVFDHFTLNLGGGYRVQDTALTCSLLIHIDSLSEMGRRVEVDQSSRDPEEPKEEER